MSYIPRITPDEGDLFHVVLTKLRERSGHTYRSISEGTGISYGRIYAMSNDNNNLLIPNGREIILLLDFFSQSVDVKKTTLQSWFIRGMRNSVNSSQWSKFIKLSKRNKKKKK